MQVITIGNEKGGVGKSTIACNLAVVAAKEGKKVLLMDADVQGSSAAFRALREEREEEKREKGEKAQVEINAVSVHQPTIHKDIAAFQNFDLVIIDVGGRDTKILRSAIAAATNGLFLIPVLPSQYDIWATYETLETLNQIRSSGLEISAAMIINRQLTQNTTISKDAKNALEELKDGNNVILLNTVLYGRVDYQKAVSEGLGVTEYAPSGKAADEIRMMYKEIINLLDGEN